MNWGTLYQTCVGFCIIMVIFTGAVNFVSAMGIFGTIETGVVWDNDANSTFNSTTDLSATNDEIQYHGMDALWQIAFVGGVSAGIGLVLSFITHSTVIIGVFAFSGVFWTSYLNFVNILYIGSYIPLGFIAIGTTAMVFIFAGAIIGMLGGSG